ncbi:sugar ABC transporter permease [Sphaerisporangium krabiense]|uniref:ABC-type glycerol-3-phosphate transport system permease component n=1 Tax=Sphaerisporangium krabiense TaxID=763782 RepID=A0A7W9DPM4_9ACTN|nr:carbohydrate ABC transporter permease [Sphaerisporangium krabiense]MBB5626184.1 ABC-type glycerol-3-phosphate transport system permease component [Sphaerisporangium krabiense]GII66149.1 sugar ABC transporter permease [Sphaerisporangium krabiense]
MTALARTGRVLRWAAVTAGGLAFAAVLAYAAVSAVKPAGEVLAVPLSWLPSSVEWHNIVLPFTETPFARYFGNSVFVGVTVTLLNVVTCTLAGYSFSKFSYPGRNVAFVVVLATLMVPLEVIYVPLYALIYDLGWVNSFAGLIVPAGTSAFGIFLMRQSIDTIPDELLEAARIDGAGVLRSLARIVVPLVRGPMAALALFIFMMNWDSHLWPLLVAGDDDHRTLPVGLAAMQANNLGASGVPMMMAAAVLAMLPTVLLFLSLQRRFVEGVAMSAGLR